MNRQYIEQEKAQFENKPDNWKAFGIDVREAGSPFPGSRSAIASKALVGKWQEAYQDWLKLGEFTRFSEETMLAFILATPVALKIGSSAAIPFDLPKRIWNDEEHRKALHRMKDVLYWRRILGHLQVPGKTQRGTLKNEYAKLLSENKGDEAERFFYDKEMDQQDQAEELLALAKTCAHAHGAKEDEERARNTMWFYNRNGSRMGPISEYDLKAQMIQGAISRSSLVWTKGMAAWQEATFLKAFDLPGAPAYVGELPPEIPAS